MTSEGDIWRKAVLPLDSSVQHVIEILNETSLRVVMIVDKDGQFLGTAADGDIRRGLLKGLGLDSPISTIVHYEAIVAQPGMNRDTVVRLMLEHKIQQIPIVNEHEHVVGLHLWDEVSSIVARSNIIVIMAGGLGTRLRPYTDDCPKPMLLVSGKPMLEHIVLRAKGEGFTNFVVSVQYLGHVIEEYFGDGTRFGVNISYLHEEAPMGTAGSLKFLDPLPTEPFIVTNGDLITEIRYGDLLDYHMSKSAYGTMAVRLHELQYPFGVVRINGAEIVGIEEKPILRTRINAGVYVLDPRVIIHLSDKDFCDMPALFELIRKSNGNTVAFPMHESWSDVGNEDDWKRLSS